MTTHTHQHGPEFSSTSADPKTKRAGFLDRQRATGFGVGLYRNIEDGKVAGVCAGVADYIEVDRGMLRLIVLAGLLFSGGMAIIIYLAAWLILAPVPPHLEADGDSVASSPAQSQHARASAGEP
ncbi:PspC domain-containing protein [Reinekea sp.]|jgi:phage shock protein PspC (stress-responsive transcriptional regulator)|uniref:PspC domain-containing protein n=1 Tax=Reinekea sp. TaxID=1970455 RepID=UPI002A805A7E|nr:PspC domain-containing protein [Reinekea sp.]